MARFMLVATRLEITDAIRAKYKDGSGAELVAKGESEISLTQASEVALVAGAEAVCCPLISRITLCLPPQSLPMPNSRQLARRCSISSLPRTQSSS
jgi:hypothetical protein